MKSRIFLSLLTSLSLGCSSPKPIRTEQHVDIERFMGDWYVIANIPTSMEVGAHNAVESYRLEGDKIRTTFTYRKDSFDGERKVLRPTGYVRDKESNAVWGMEFVWPFEADYRIVYLDKNYSQTIIGRLKRDYVWIMARTPSISDDDYQKLLSIVEEVGYEKSKVKKVPQRWPEEQK